MEDRTINEQFSDILADFAKKSLGGGEVTTPEVVTSQAPVVAATEPVKTDQFLEDGSRATKVAESQASKVDDNKVATPQTTPVVPVPESTTTFDDWDGGIVETSKTTTSQPAATSAPIELLSELGKVLGIEGQIQGKEDLVKAISTLKTEYEKVKPLVDKTQIKPELLKAIELDQKGGDFYSYLKVSSVDYSKTDPVQLYEDYVIDQLADANGNVDADKVNEYLDGIPALDKELRGKELQRKLINEQSRQIAEIEAEATRKREKHDSELRSALNSLAEVDGFKVDDRHRRESFEWVTSGKMMRDLFYGPDGNFDPVKTAKIAFRNLYYDKLDAYHKNRIKNTTKREILAEVSNAQISSPGVQTNITPVTKEFGVKEYIESLERQFLTR